MINFNTKSLKVFINDEWTYFYWQEIHEEQNALNSNFFVSVNKENKISNSNIY